MMRSGSGGEYSSPVLSSLSDNDTLEPDEEVLLGEAERLGARARGGLRRGKHRWVARG